MEIGVFFTYGYSLQTWKNTGTLKREIKIFEEISKKYEVNFTLITYGDSSELEILNTNERIKIYPLYENFKHSKNNLIRFIKSIFFARKLRKDLNYVDVFYSNQLLGTWVPLVIKLFTNKPVLIRTGYDMLDFAYKDNKKSYIIFFYKILTFVSIKFSDIFTVTNKTDKNRLEKDYPKYSNKILLRPNWVDSVEYNEIDNRHKNRIIAVGRLVEQKNFTYLLNEFSNLKKDIVIDIIGEGLEKSNLEMLAKEKNLEVNFLGSKEHKELMNQYRKYKYFISTSTFEGNPKTVLEAMASGCIVLASNIDNHSEIIDDHINGFLFDLNLGGLKKAYEEVDENIDLKKVSKNAVNKTLEVNSLDKCIDDTFNDLKSLISKS